MPGSSSPIPPAMKSTDEARAATHSPFRQLRRLTGSSASPFSPRLLPLQGTPAVSLSAFHRAPIG
jgi:hypothetical protein